MEAFEELPTSPTPTSSSRAAIPAPSGLTEHYDRLAFSYDDATTFHKSLAEEYVKYVKPVAGESLLDLACGTGLVAFALNSHARLSYIHGIDISSRMLDIACSKISSVSNHIDRKGIILQPVDFPQTDVLFEHHDITSLSALPSLSEKEGTFDVITICSAFVLLPTPLESLRSWIPYLKPASPTAALIPGGRLVLDIPHPCSMIGLLIFSKLAPKFGISVLGPRNWIGSSEGSAMKNLKNLMHTAGLTKVETFKSRIFHDIPAATPLGEGIGRVIREGTEAERREWPATREAGSKIYDLMTKRPGLHQWREGTENENNYKKESWIWEWIQLGVSDEDGEIWVREEGALIIGIGWRD
ncbi:3593e057-bb66-484a-98ec-687ca213fc35 [Sclerotinia trifoliorum]|uniref:3593e057-bb66-484a-98ec-687ca213fc35 n=1 Tax=Sclerotinia trifoliorum TaxID=28548 RepID=A0A8H2ZVP2_9HELO|nr:3593e057-bb66-484a-98ec-687ca213fc35 [Sclerotinia trifoliorum]